MPVDPRALALSEVIPVALDELGVAGHTIVLDLAADLHEVNADPDLLQRIIANVAANALRYAPAGSPVSITVPRRPRAAGRAHHDLSGGVSFWAARVIGAVAGCGV
jgi:K+-sensing histidine kinase KdpD